MQSVPRRRRSARPTASVLLAGVATMLAAAALAVFGGAGAASAHGFSSVAYADVTSPAPATVRVTLQLEYDLLLVSAATSEQDDGLFQEGQPAWENGDYPGMIAAVRDHLGAVGGYVLDHVTVAAYGGAACAGTLGDSVDVRLNDTQQVPYATVVADFACPAMGRTEAGHTIGSTLFPNAEGFVSQGTTTIVVYDVDDRSGSATLDERQTTFSTEQAWYERFAEFFRLGAEHLLTGPDHILFLLALIAGSRRLREVVLAATSFTVAHSITFILAALGVVSPPAILVEPTIALSIAAVAGWYLIRLIRKRDTADQLVVAGDNHFALDRAGWLRLAIVFAFGLIHGLGFAGALGIREAFSWQLLWSLLVFNVGIEAVQIGLILILFPPLMLLRRRAHRASLWVTGALTAFVVVVGLVWFAERLLGVSDWPAVPGVQ
ncbi:HupE/UreJ family protein [Galbitalea sp. SE-J8]|uniref:HupE/UreJ family protein n=1 Tax=Galbitalea sp. SE-J8 TaxID=3054952 RepID=UPI00259C8631|nr:HupE/UreJ family protein [Galbitalea sp. SE-J8]MDM4762425.1 HupE/UreJ family protein [Galbitalea sp. SE-J8]